MDWVHINSHVPLWWHHYYLLMKQSDLCIVVYNFPCSPCTGGVPPDGTPNIIVKTVFPPLYITYFVAVAVGITFAIVCLLFNCIFRNRKWVDFLVWWYVLTYALHYHHATLGSSAWLVQISTTSSLLVPCYFMHLLFFTSSPQPVSSLLR